MKASAPEETATVAPPTACLTTAPERQAAAPAPSQKPAESTIEKPGLYFPAADEGENFEDESPPGFVLEYRPPPICRLPQPLAEYITKSADAIGCDPALVAMPALAACGAAIGDSRAVVVKTGWIEFPVLWTLAIAPSGQFKTPAIKAAMEGLETAQREAFDSYRVAELQFKAALAEWKKNGCKGQEPEAPKLVSFYIGDATLEAVCVRLRDNPRGLLQKRDELSGWLGSFDRYNAGNESAQWLEFHNANPLRIDRASAGTIYVPRALVGVTGTIQEPVLRKALSEGSGQHFDNGLAARFLMAMPPERARGWREAVTPPELTKRFVGLFKDLLALSPEIDEQCERRNPVLVEWSPEARERFVEFVNRHGQEMMDFKSDKLKSAWSKLEAQAARIALIFHCVRHAYLPGPDNAGQISVATLDAALEWTEWLKNETRHIYYTLTNDGNAGHAAKLLKFAKSNGGRCTARDAARVGAGGRDANEVMALMRSLIAAGFGEWGKTELPKGGRPTRYFVVKDYLCRETDETL